MTEPHTTAAPGTGTYNGTQPPDKPNGDQPSGHRGGVTGNGARVCARFIAAALLAVILVLAGCSTPPTPPPTATGVATAVPETTAPPTAVAGPYKPATAEGPAQNVPVPVLPEAAKEFSKDGLIAFTEYWYSTLGYAFETGDTQPMLESSSPSCEMCKAMKETVVPWHEEGRWIVGGQMTVLDTNATFSPTKDGNYQVMALVRQNHLQFYRADSTISKDLGQEPSVADVLVAVHDSGRWSAIKIGRLDGSPS